MSFIIISNKYTKNFKNRICKFVIIIEISRKEMFMFQKNIDAIRQKNPGLAEKLEKIDIESIKDDITVAEAETKDLIIGYKELALHSTFDPIREAKAIWNKSVKAELKKNDIQIIFGLGLGYLFKRAYVSSESKVFLIDPQIEILRFVLEHVDLSTELSDKRVYITDNPKDIVEKLRKEYLKGDRTEFLFLPAYSSISQECMTELTGSVVKVMEEKSADVNTIFKLAPVWTINFIKNLPKFSKFLPLGFFKDTFAGKAALIASPGPSLAKNIETIKKNRDKFVMMAVGKAIKVLADNGITPDFVTFADAVALEHQVKGAEEILKNTNIIMTSKTDSLIAELEAKNKILYLAETDPFTKLFNKNSSTDPGCYQSASSVSIINYFAAKELGFKTIAFAGLDLAFPGNQLYANGQDLKVDENGFIELYVGGNLLKTKKVEYVNDKDGNKLATRDDYLLFIRQFEDILEEEKSLIRVINTATSGAYVNGMEYLELDELLSGLDEQNINIDETISSISQNKGKDWSDCVEKVSEDIWGRISNVRQISEKVVLIRNDIKDMIGLIEKQPGKLPDYNLVNDLKAKINAQRNEVIKEEILQNGLQGELWMYTKDYTTNNLMGREVVLSNLKAELRLFNRICGYSEKVLNTMESSVQNARELNRI